MAKVIRLPNGIKVINEERAGSGKVAMRIFIKSGSAHETDAENGITNLMQEATQGGTTTRTHDEIFEQLLEAGSGLSSEASKGGVDFWTEVLARKSEDAFAVIADVLRNPAFDAGEIEKTKGVIEQIREQSQQNPRTITTDLFLQQVFAGQARANPVEGSPENLAGFTAAQVKAKYDEIMANPSNIFISFCGDMDDSTAQKLVEQHFGDLPASGRPANANPPATFVGGDARLEQENDQTSFSLAFPAPSKADPDRYAALLLREVIGGGMSSPLFQEIREKRGLVYSVGAGYSPMDTTGLFNIGGSSGKGNMGEFVSVTLDMLGDAMRTGFTPEDLAQARQRLLQGDAAGAEAAEDAAEGNLESVIAHGRIVDPLELDAKLAKVTSSDLQRVLFNMLDSGKYALAAVGPLETLQSEQDIKDMMAAQAKGFIPAPVPAPQPSVAAAFNPAAAATVKDAGPKVTVLANGIQIITHERPGSLSAGAWVGAGSDHENPDNNGATHALEHMSFKGTPNWPAGSIQKYIEGVLGGGLNAYTTRDMTAYYNFELKADALDKIIEIAGEMVFFPTLPHEAFDGKTTIQKNGKPKKNKGERDVIIEELNEARDDVGDHRNDLLAATSYPDQPHGWTILGPESTLRKMSVEDLKTFHDAHYAPNNVIFAVVGPVKHEDVVALVEAKFGHLKPMPIPPLPVPVYEGGTAFEESKKAKVANIALSAAGTSRTDADGHALDLLGGVLGAGQSSRLYREIVTQKELAPAVGAGHLQYRNAGTFLIGTSVAPEDVKETMNIIYKNLRAVADDLSDAELSRIKAVMEMDLLGNFESNGDAVNEYAVNLQAFGKLVTPADISDAIGRVTVDDVKAAARKILAQNPTAIGVVPAGTDKSLLPTHAEVVAMRDGTWQAPAANSNAKPAKPKPPAVA